MAGNPSLGCSCSLDSRETVPDICLEYNSAKLFVGAGVQGPFVEHLLGVEVDQKQGGWLTSAPKPGVCLCTAGP